MACCVLKQKATPIFEEISFAECQVRVREVCVTPIHPAAKISILCTCMHIYIYIYINMK